MGRIQLDRKDIQIMNEIILVSTQLTGTQQTIAKWTLLIALGIWALLAIINKWKGKDE